MKDYKLTLRDLRASHTLGWSIVEQKFFFWIFFLFSSEDCLKGKGKTEARWGERVGGKQEVQQFWGGTDPPLQNGELFRLFAGAARHV